MNLLPIEQALDCGLTVRGLRTETRDKFPLGVFLHGNGFAAGVYLPLYKALHRHMDLLMFDIPGHGKSDQAVPFAGWNKTAEMLYQALVKTGLGQNRSVYGLGHSLGGVFTLLAAHAHPNDYQALVLLDPILFPRKLLLLMRLVSRLGLTSRVHPHVASTLRRRRHWPDRQSAYNYFHGRKIYRDWTDASLQSFIDFAIKDDPTGGVTLSCAPEMESRYFASLPKGMWKALGSIGCETRILMGESSYPFALKAALTAQANNSAISCHTVPGSHCFMQEDPQHAAAEVLLALGLSADR